jgi:hypothetical protein
MFGPFSKLPTKLRVYIWELAIFTRLIKISNITPEPRRHDNTVYVKTCTPCPAFMHACRESRSYARYQRSFDYGSDPRYTFVNFDFDMISCAWIDFESCFFDKHRSGIRRARVLVTDRSLIVYCQGLARGGTNFEMAIRDVLPFIQEIHNFDGRILLDVNFFQPDFWTSVQVPIKCIQSFDPTTGSVIVDSRWYLPEGYPAQPFLCCDSDARWGTPRGGEDLRKFICDATPVSERHLVRFQISEDRGQFCNDTAKIVADVYQGRPIPRDIYSYKHRVLVFDRCTGHLLSFH